MIILLVFIDIDNKNYLYLWFCLLNVGLSIFSLLVTNIAFPGPVVSSIRHFVACLHVLLGSVYSLYCNNDIYCNII